MDSSWFQQATQANNPRLEIKCPMERRDYILGAFKKLERV
jgi:hypothetical protein